MRRSDCGGRHGRRRRSPFGHSLGLKVILTEETDWVGGQLTSQAVPPDEHPWIEQFGCTARYRAYRDGVRAYYRQHTPLLPFEIGNLKLNPGGGWVSRLCHEPAIGVHVLTEMLQPAVASGNLEVHLNRVPVSADASGDEVQSVTFRDLTSGKETTIHAAYVLDATELSDLLPMTLAEYVVGAESKRETHEPHAVDGPAEPDNIQGLTWCCALAHDEGSHRVIDQPAQYEKWKTYWPPFWPAPLLGFEVLHAHTGAKVHLPLFSTDWYALFPYRQIVRPEIFAAGYAPHPVTIVNWPQNDYFEHSIIDVDEQVAQSRLQDSKQLGLSLLYWLQTEAPRHDGGTGYPGLYLRPDITGTADGFAKSPYIRESRRFQTRFTVLEQHVAAYTNEGRDRAFDFPDSVGVGAYRIDLHPSTNGCNTIDTSTLPFQIPLGSLVHVRMRNLLPACKNLGVTHITNGCYRLHPVEWNLGEAAGLLAGFCLQRRTEPAAVLEDTSLTREFQSLLVAQGIEIEWPKLHAL